MGWRLRLQQLRGGGAAASLTAVVAVLICDNQPTTRLQPDIATLSTETGLAGLLSDEMPKYYLIHDQE